MPTYTSRSLGEIMFRVLASLGKGELVTFGTATAGAAGTLTADANTCPSTTADDARYIGKWLYVFAGIAAGDTRRISAYSTGRVISAATNFSATPTTASQFFISLVDPRLIERAVLRAQEYLADNNVAMRPITGREIVLGSALENNFDLFTTADVLDGVTLDSNSTFTSQTTVTLGGRRVLRMVTDGTNAGFVRFSIPRWGKFQGKTVRLYVHLRTSIAARTTIQFNDGVTTATEDTATTANDWELLEASQSMGDAATQARVSIEVSVGAAVTVEMAYWYTPEPFRGEFVHPIDADRNIIAIGDLWLSAGSVTAPHPEAHTFPHPVEDSAWAWFEDADDTPRKLRLRIGSQWMGHVLEYKAYQRHTELTAGAATTNWGGEPDVIIPRAKYFLLEMIGAENSALDRALLAAERIEARHKVPVGFKRILGT